MPCWPDSCATASTLWRSKPRAARTERPERTGRTSVSDMRLVVTGAAGRMGRMLVGAIHAMPGVVLAAALEHAGSPALGQDAGLLAGLGDLGVAIGDDPLQAFVAADAVI